MFIQQRNARMPVESSRGQAGLPAPSPTPRPDLRPRRLRRSASRGFTLVELIIVVASVAIFIALVMPAVQKAQQAIRDAEMQSELSGTICDRIHYYEDHYLRFPTSLSDPQFTALFDPHLIDPVTKEVTYEKELGYTLTYQLTEGGRNFDLCATNMARTFCIDKTCKITYPGEQLPFSAPPVPPAVLASAAQTVVSLIDLRPELAGQVRQYTASPDALNTVFNTLDTDHNEVITLDELDANPFIQPFSPLLHDHSIFSADIDAATVITRADLVGEGSFLFSYEALRELAKFYSGDARATNGLIAKLDAAEAAEQRGDADEKAELLGAFRNQVRAKSGKPLTALQAHVLTVLSQTL